MVFGNLNLDAELTKHQEDVAKLLGSGLTYQEAADRLGVTRRTLDGHCCNIRKKINGFDRADIVVFAIKTKLVKL